MILDGRAGVFGLIFIALVMGFSVYSNSRKLDRIPEDVTSSDEEKCIKKGGEWRVVGMGPDNRCIIKMIDAGRPCTSNEDCKGLCLASIDSKPGEKAVGECSQYNLVVGCHSTVSGGIVDRMLCSE